MSECLHVGGLRFQVRRGPRRKTLGLTVDRAGELVVHSPLATNREELREWVNTRLLWVHRKLALKEHLNRPSRRLEYVSGESFFWIGRNYRLKLVDEASYPLSLEGQRFFLRRKDRKDAADHFRRWYIRQGAAFINDRGIWWQPRLNVQAAKVTVGELGYRWGSCGKGHRLYFNWRLLQLPLRFIDYIVVHEMAHLIEHNHTRKFWEIIGYVLPDWEQRKAELESRWQDYASFGMPNSGSIKKRSL
jgi:predicted metal-dependent hydrolase